MGMEGGGFEIISPRSMGWKNFGGSCTRRVGFFFKISKFSWTSCVSSLTKTKESLTLLLYYCSENTDVKQNQGDPATKR